MKRIVVDAFGGPEMMSVQEEAPLVASSGGVVVAVEAIGVGLVDLLARRGVYPLLREPGFTPGVEVAGEVIETGDGVPDEWLNKKVLALTVPSGGYAQQVSTKIDNIFPLPAAISARNAVALRVNALVARTIFDRVGIKKGDRVLVRGGGGGIGVMAVQIGAQMGGAVGGYIFC